MGRGVSQKFRCRADTVPRVRAVVGEELRRNGINGDLFDRLVLASAEACNNAILHSDSTSYDVSIDIDKDECTVTVSDSGAGFEVPDEMEMPAPDSLSQRGLALMCVLVDDVEVTSDENGTTVVLRQALDTNHRHSNGHDAVAPIS